MIFKKLRCSYIEMLQHQGKVITMTDIIDAAYEHHREVKKKFRFRIVYNKNKCISSGHCVLSDPYNWLLDDEFKADLVGGKEISPGIFEKIVETDEPHLVINAAKTCTPRVIAVIDMDKNKRIAP